MKKYLKLSLLLVFISMFSTTLEMKSQSDCDCVGSWTEETEFFDGRDISCQFIVTYEKCSDGSEGPFHLRITGLEFLDGGNCENLSEEYIMHYATRLLLDECDQIFYTADWQSTVSPSYREVSVRTNECWLNDETDLLPCGSNYCCSNYYMDWFAGIMEVTDQSTESFSETCTSIGVDPCDLVCDGLEMPEYIRLLEPTSYIDCYGDCPTVPWSERLTAYSTSENPNLEIEYATRTCNGVTEFHIFEIKSSSYISGGSESQLYRRAIETVLADLGGTSGGTFRLNQNSCWQVAGSLYLIPCWYPGNCCVTTYYLYFDDDLLLTYHSHTGGSCNCTSPCTCLCAIQDDFEKDEEISAKSIHIFSNENGFSENKTYVKPNPTTGKIEIYLESEVEGDVECSIYNNIGYKIFSVYDNKSNVISVDLSDKPDGTYYYEIKLRNGAVLRNKFVLIK